MRWDEVFFRCGIPRFALWERTFNAACHAAATASAISSAG